MRCGVVGVLRNGDLFRCLSKGNHCPHVFKGDVSGSACRRGNNQSVRRSAWPVPTPLQPQDLWTLPGGAMAPSFP